MHGLKTERNKIVSRKDKLEPIFSVTSTQNKTILTDEKRWQLVTYIRQLQANAKPKIN